MYFTGLHTGALCSSSKHKQEYLEFSDYLIGLFFSWLTTLVRPATTTTTTTCWLFWSNVKRHDCHNDFLYLAGLLASVAVVVDTYLGYSDHIGASAAVAGHRDRLWPMLDSLGDT